MTATLEWLDPRNLIVDTNIRTDLKLDADFTASIRESGVLVPIVAERTDQGVRVRAGHRRTAAAVQAGLDTIPVMLINADGGDTTRIIDQLVENTHRAGLTTADTVAAVEQLTLLGCSAAQIAKRTRISRPAVDQALVIADTDATRKNLDSTPGLTLEMAAWLAEFEDDPEEWESLRDTFLEDPTMARHELEQARRNRRFRTALSEARSQAAAAHPNATPFDGDLYSSKTADKLAWLRNPDGSGITPEDHTSCPGHGYYLHQAYGPRADTADLRIDGFGWDYEWVCVDWPTNGHLSSYSISRSTSQPNTAPSDETAREQRRRTIDLNKAGDAAKTVREEWLTNFTKHPGKKMPADWEAFLFLDMAENDPCADDKYIGLAQARAITQLADSDLENISTHRAAHLLLCARLWSHERRASREIWRQTQHTTYLQYLQAWGYTLAPVEQAGADLITAEAAHQAIVKGDN